MRSHFKAGKKVIFWPRFARQRAKFPNLDFVSGAGFRRPELIFSQARGASGGLAPLARQPWGARLAVLANQLRGDFDCSFEALLC